MVSGKITSGNKSVTIKNDIVTIETNDTIVKIEVNDKSKDKNTEKKD